MRKKKNVNKSLKSEEKKRKKKKKYVPTKNKIYTKGG